jgi:hypothetical protein
LPINSNHIQTHEVRLYGAAVQYFGGWRQAVHASGIDYESIRKVTFRQWTEQSIIQEIVRRKLLGLPIRSIAVSKEDRGLYQAARRHFGKNGWERARVLAGLDPREPDSRIIWNTRTVCEEIRFLYKNNISLNTGSLMKNGYSYIHAAGRKVFGSWEAALTASGLDYAKIQKHRQRGYWTKSRILEAIRRLEQEGVRLSSKHMQQTAGALYSSSVLRFGSWSQAVEAAGINYMKHCRVWSTKAWLRRMPSPL